MRTDAGQNRYDRERNPRGDEAIFDGRSRRFVPQEGNEIPPHQDLLPQTPKTSVKLWLIGQSIRELGPELGNPKIATTLTQLAGRTRNPTSPSTLRWQLIPQL